MARQLEALRAQMRQFNGDAGAIRAKLRGIAKRCHQLHADVDAILADSALPDDVAARVRDDLRQAQEGLTTADRALSAAGGRLDSSG